jgi:hypothetical protein
MTGGVVWYLLWKLATSVLGKLWVIKASKNCTAERIKHQELIASELRAMWFVLELYHFEIGNMPLSVLVAEIRCKWGIVAGRGDGQVLVISVHLTFTWKTRFLSLADGIGLLQAPSEAFVELYHALLVSGIRFTGILQ